MKKEADAGMLQRILRMAVTRRVPVFAGHREIAPLLGTAQRCWLFDKPYRIVAGITGSESAVCRTGGHGADRVTGFFLFSPLVSLDGITSMC